MRGGTPDSPRSRRHRRQPESPSAGEPHTTTRGGRCNSLTGLRLFPSPRSGAVLLSAPARKSCEITMLPRPVLDEKCGPSGRRGGRPTPDDPSGESAHARPLRKKKLRPMPILIGYWPGMSDDRPRRFERRPSFRATILDTSPRWQERLAAQQDQRAADTRSPAQTTSTSSPSSPC